MATENPWIEWTGGDCPVSKSTLVDVYFRGDEYRGLDRPAGPSCRAGEVTWDRPFAHDGLGDIIAYRVVSA